MNWTKSGSTKSKDIKNKLLFLKRALKTEVNKLLKDIVIKDIKNKETNWAKLVIKYMYTVNLNFNSIQTFSSNALKIIFMIGIELNGILTWKPNLHKNSTEIIKA